jgi:hypothetical protein
VWAPQSCSGGRVKRYSHIHLQIGGDSWSRVTTWHGRHRSAKGGQVALQVVGAGLGRTGTESLKHGLERLLGGPCYHMFEIVAGRPDDIPVWLAAARGEFPVWNDFLADYRAAVDWPAASFWRELSAANPEAIVLLSVRDVDEWWTSVSNTIFAPALDVAKAKIGFPADWPDAVLEARFTPDWRQETEAKSAYLRHNDSVRSEVPADRLVEWSPVDGWGPICKALALAIPDEPFPHVNTTADFQALLQSLSVA